MQGRQKVVDAVQWHEGMLLTPQHFQQSDQRWQQISNFCMKVASPFYWGVTHVEYDTVSLVNGVLRVTALEGVMPDGLIASIGFDDELELDLVDLVEKTSHKPTTIHLAVSSYKDDEPNATGDFPRFVSLEGKPVIDDNTGMGEQPIPRIRPKFQLISGDQVPARYTSFPLIKIRFKEDVYAIEEFIPPLIQVSLGSRLGDRLTDFVKVVREKIAYISERLQSQGSATATQKTQEAEKIFSALVSGLVQFESVLNTSVSHPYMLYIALSHMIGHLTTIRKGQIPPIFKPYQHNDLHTSFSQMLEFGMRLVDDVKESYHKEAFALQENTFVLQLKKEWVRDEIIIGLSPQQNMSKSDLAAWMDRAVVATKTAAHEAIDKRVLGAPRQIKSAQDSLGTLTGKDIVVYTITADPDYINFEEELQIFNPSEDEVPYEIIMYV